MVCMGTTNACCKGCLGMLGQRKIRIYCFTHAMVPSHHVLHYWNALRLVAAAAKSLQSCPTPCGPIDGSPPGSRPWDSPDNNTGVGCHFLLQCMKVKSESEVAQSCLTLSNPMDYSPPGSSVHGIFQARVLEWGAIALSIRLVEEPTNHNCYPM